MNVKTYLYKCQNDAVENNSVASQILHAIQSISVRLESGCSSRLRQSIQEYLSYLGWSSKVQLSYDSRITITAMKNDCALCLQTGNISRIYADLLKLEYLYRKEKMKLAIYILPTKKNARIMGSNLAYFERLVEELNLFNVIISTPILVIGID